MIVKGWRATLAFGGRHEDDAIAAREEVVGFDKDNDMKHRATAIGLAALAAPLLCATAPALAGAAYITNEKADTVTVIDTDKMEATKTFPVGRRPRGVAVSSSFS